jgi:hypothetical protein
MSAMREQLQARLATLKEEYLTGQGQLRELGQQEAALRETMLRISGAIQVLEELLASNAQPVDPERQQAASGDGTAQNELPSRPEVLTVP